MSNESYYVHCGKWIFTSSPNYFNNSKPLLVRLTNSGDIGLHGDISYEDGGVHFLELCYLFLVAEVAGKKTKMMVVILIIIYILDCYIEQYLPI